MEAAPRSLTSFLIIGGRSPGQPRLAQVMAVVDSDDPDTIIMANLQPGEHQGAERGARRPLGTRRERLDALWDGLHEHFVGLHLSVETDPRPERVEDAFPPAMLARLRELKLRYDPENLFRDNFPVVEATTI